MMAVTSPTAIARTSWTSAMTPKEDESNDERVVLLPLA